ncbi:MAG: ankyrin repeat domain-containing protein [Bryobacteraceae bacterium]
MTQSPPANPSLENLKKQAKTVQKAWRAGGAEAIARIRAAHPQYAGLSDDQIRAIQPRLTDCQLVLAREAGFDSWPQLKAAVQAANRELPDEFVEMACLCYDDPHYDHRSFHARAHEMLRAQPWLSEVNIWCAAAAGNTGAVRTFLDGEPELAGRPGPHGWEPLICACYSRVKPVDPAHSTFEAAKLLLDRGADPNAYTIKGNADERLAQTPRRFTALTGMFGDGSTGLANQPPHPRWRELAELLLARGANPADQEALSINQGACLEMLLRHGLKPDAMGRGGITLMGRALSQAARQGHAGQVRLLLAHHARTDEKLRGKLPWEHAMERGNPAVARLLEEAGAPVAELNDVERFVAACMAGDERGARAMLERDPELRARADQHMVSRAVSTKRPAAVKLVLDLGFDPNHIEDNAAIHHAGTLVENEEILRILLAHGASLTLRDPWYDSTAIGWANFFGYADLRDRLLSEPGICLFDALDYDRLDRVPEILARDPAALERRFAECLSREPKPENWQTPLVRMVVGGKTEAVRVLLDHGADVSARHPDGRPVLQIARAQGFEEIARLLEARTSSG